MWLVTRALFKPNQTEDPYCFSCGKLDHTKCDCKSNLAYRMTIIAIESGDGKYFLSASLRHLIAEHFTCDPFAATPRGP